MAEAYDRGVEHVSQLKNEADRIRRSVCAQRALHSVNPLRPNNDVSQTSHCNIKGVSVREVMRIENMINQVQCY